jgi:hypothetical protein
MPTSLKCWTIKSKILIMIFFWLQIKKLFLFTQIRFTEPLIERRLLRGLCFLLWR